MSLILLIALSIGLGQLGFGAFFWALKNVQFDDSVGATWRIIPPEHSLETEGEIR